MMLLQCVWLVWPTRVRRLWRLVFRQRNRLCACCQTFGDLAMMNRRSLLAGLAVLGASTALVSTVAVPALAHHTKKRVWKLDRRFLPQRVRYSSRERRGTVIVDPRNHFLYLIEGRNRARRYGIGVGKAGRGFSGVTRVGRKAKWPRWQPTANMIRREPNKYARYAKGVPGGPGNPLGARALYLYRGNRDTMYRIHGTNEPSSIGRSVSNGCVRMINAHVTDLYERVPVGAKVIVL